MVGDGRYRLTRPHPQAVVVQTSPSRPSTTFQQFASSAGIISPLIILYREIDQNATHLRIDFPQ
jgi:hypothetical protein